MPAVDYQAGGVFWPKVQAVMTACSCTRLRAVSALKSSQNDENAAIASLQETLKMQITTNSQPISNIPTLDRPNSNTSVAGSFHVSTGDLARTLETTSLNRIERTSTPQSDSTLVTSEDEYRFPTSVAPSKGGYYKTPGDFGNSRHTPSANPPRRSPFPPVPSPRPVVFTPETRPPPAAFPPPSLTSKQPWDFRLPPIVLGPSEPPFSYDEGKTTRFSARRLISALQIGLVTPHKLSHYLSFFSTTVIRSELNGPVDGYPATFFAIATNDDGLVRTWIEAGGDANATEPNHGIPLLAFALLMPPTGGTDTTAVAVRLMSLGADVARIPPVFYAPYMDDPADKMPFSETEFRTPETAWCRDWVRPLLASKLNLTERYALYNTSRDKGPSDRQMQVARMHGATALLGVSYFIVGQRSAARMVTQRLLSYLALPKAKPLVMVFAGPSGHGKTELAKRMGELLTLEIECVDCTEMKYESDLFGPKRPYLGYEHGSPVNNFLVRMQGQRCIVFLDEFEKTTPEVQNSLLIPFDEGRYTDRRNREAVDVSQTIWVIATNAVDNIILDFCESNHDTVFDNEDVIQHSALMNDLSGRLRKQLKSEFGNPLSGRISMIIPFLPFSPGEAAVVAHKYVLELQRRVIQSVKVSDKQLLGRIDLEVHRDGAICGMLASEGYDCDQGARSLKSTVDGRLEDELVHAYLMEEGQITDTQPLMRYAVDLGMSGGLSVFKRNDEQ